MTDKQNFEKDICVPSKNNKYRLGRTKIERQQIFEDIKEMIENGFSLQNIADKYGVTRQAISLKMINCGFNVSQEVKRIKREKIKKLLEETSVNNVEKLNLKVKYYKTYNIRLRNDLIELKEKLLRKEQECEELKKIIDEAKNSKLDLKSFLVGEAVQNEYEQQLDQLKAENDTYKKMLDDKEVQLALTEIRSGERHLWFNKADKLSKTLTEIKSILELYANSKVGEEQSDGTYKLSSGILDSFGFCTTTYDPRPARQALQKISECEDLKKQHQANKGLITSAGKINYQLLQEYDKNRTYIQQVQAENGYFRNKSEKSEVLIKKIIDFVQKEIEYFNHDEEYQCDWKELLKIIESEVKNEHNG